MRLFENTAGTEDVFNGIIIAGPEARFEPKVARLAQYQMSPDDRSGSHHCPVPTCPGIGQWITNAPAIGNSHHRRAYHCLASATDRIADHDSAY